jgi:hypothetical protein
MVHHLLGCVSARLMLYFAHRLLKAISTATRNTTVAAVVFLFSIPASPSSPASSAWPCARGGSLSRAMRKIKPLQRPKLRQLKTVRVFALRSTYPHSVPPGAILCVPAPLRLHR